MVPNSNYKMHFSVMFRSVFIREIFIFRPFTITIQMPRLLFEIKRTEFLILVYFA